MATSNLKLGKTVPIALKLFDGATDKYVRAYVKLADGSSMASSPFAVPHVATGLYLLTTETMPETEFLTVEYKVYDDAGFTTLSDDHADALDIFILDSESSPFVHLTGSIESNTLIGVVREC